MIISFKIFESKISKDKNPVTWKGIPFWIGIFDSTDGEIIDTWTFETARDCDFHHSFYMNIEYLDKIKDGEYIVFWFNNNTCEIDNRNMDNYEHFLKKIISQLDNKF